MSPTKDLAHEAAMADQNVTASAFDIDEAAERVRHLELAWSDWRLEEKAEFEVGFYRHAGHDPDAIRWGVYEETREAIARMLPGDYPLSLERLMDHHGHRELAED